MNKKTKFACVIFHTSVICILLATTTTALGQGDSLRWFRLSDLNSASVSGKGWNEDTATIFYRLPQRARHVVREEVWDLAKNTAGEYIDFTTRSAQITVRYQVDERLSMPHMPATGVSGVDLYVKNKDGSWSWLNEKFMFGDTVVYRYNTSSSLNNVRFFRLYLPLYNSIRWLEIGTNPSNLVEPVIDEKAPITLYGTSILQGGCASRPGLAWTNILGRKLDIRTINLGFSGNGRLEMPVIELLVETNPRLFVLDCLPNLATDSYPDDTIRERILTSVKMIRSKYPLTPILLAEHASGLREVTLNSGVVKECSRANNVLKAAMRQMVQEGIKNIWTLTAEEIGFHAESTVDGIHPNDIGMMQYAEAYEKKIKMIFSSVGEEGH